MADKKTGNAATGYKQIFDDAKKAALKSCETLARIDAAGDPAKTETELIRAGMPTSSIEAMRQFNRKEITEAEMIAAYFRGLATQRSRPAFITQRSHSFTLPPNQSRWIGA